MSNLMPSLETFAKGAFATAAGLSTLGVGLLYYGQNFLIYPSAFPPGSRTAVPVPTDFGLPYEDLTLHTPDNVGIRAYLLLQTREVGSSQAREVDYAADETDSEFAARRPTVIMFHGNGGNHGHRIPLARVFFVKMRCNVLLVSYRGYGLSEGSPSEKGICIDAQTALDYVRSDPHLGKTTIVLYGQSIGGAVAIDLASRNPSAIGALILENTFTSLPSLVPHALPVLGPFTFLCHQKWDSAAKIPRIPATTAMLLLSGAKDEVVPRAHMAALWEGVARRGEKRSGSGREYKVGLERAKFVEFAEGTHNDTCVQAGYWNVVAEFIDNNC